MRIGNFRDGLQNDPCRLTNLQRSRLPSHLGLFWNRNRFNWLRLDSRHGCQPRVLGFQLGLLFCPPALISFAARIFTSKIFASLRFDERLRRSNSLDLRLESVEYLGLDLGPFGIALGKVDQGHGAGNHLAIRKHGILAPIARFHENRHNDHLAQFGAIHDPRHFVFLNELRVQERLTHDKQGDLCLIDLRFDVGSEFVAGL